MNTHTSGRKVSVSAVIIVALAATALGYFLFRSSPQSQAPVAVGDVDHHGGAPVAADVDALNALVGKPMPGIQLADRDGRIYAAADFRGKVTILFFNEGLMCYPACWNQIAAFGADARFNNDRIQAVSVVVDSATDWQRAISQMPQLAKATTMFDAGADASRRLGILSTDSSMHRGALPGHTYLVLDAGGIVRYALDDPNMAIANDSLFARIEAL